MKITRILLTGGGTGGHVFPLVAVTRTLKRHGVDVAFIGPEEFSLDVLRDEHIHVRTITPAGKLRRYFSLKTIGEIARFPKAFFESIFFIRKWQPDIMLGKGGYGSIAPVLAARMLGVPVVLHESDVFPGLANRTLSRFARAIAISFKETEEYFSGKKTELCGNPVRLKHTAMERNEAKKILGITTRRKIIFILGGSQGAQSINMLLAETAPAIVEQFGLIASTGSNKTPQMLKKVGSQKHVVVKEFLNEKELAAAYTLADVVVSRAGASSIFETAAFAKPSILIPLKSAAGDHQTQNARAYEEAGGCIVLEEDELNAQVFRFSIESAIKNQALADSLIRGAKTFAVPDAAERVARLLLESTLSK